jgi:hypothetical protein
MASIHATTWKPLGADPISQIDQEHFGPQKGAAATP